VQKGWWVTQIEKADQKGGGEIACENLAFWGAFAMGQIKNAEPVKMLVGLLAARKELFDAVRMRLEQVWGPVDLQSEIMDFDYTRYYDNEMGRPLYRRFLSFEKRIDPGLLSGIKVATNALEDELAVNGRRQVNIDPGYLTPAKLVLATTKDRAHRIYLGKGIYAEVTLLYQGGAFRELPWTYPDYRSEKYRAFFTRVREICLRQQKEVEKRE
jgi:hypothetical protein